MVGGLLLLIGLVQALWVGLTSWSSKVSWRTASSCETFRSRESITLEDNMMVISTDILSSLLRRFRLSWR
jgi:hypothetical protein